jgi:hypothetical protein
MGTINASQLYGPSPLGLSLGGGVGAPADEASGPPNEGAGVKTPAIFWVGMIALLVALRLLWEYAGGGE